VLPAYAWGSHRSRLVDCIRAGHHDVQLSRKELERLITWIDLNAPYYGSYSSAYPNNPYGRSPLDHRQLERLAELAGRSVDRFKHDPALQISFTRPELSPLLSLFRDKDAPEYKEVFSIIRAGCDQLSRRPREDNLGSVAAVRPRANGQNN
jgi:hypothetical protein